MWWQIRSPQHLYLILQPYEFKLQTSTGCLQCLSRLLDNSASYVRQIFLKTLLKNGGGLVYHQ